MCLYNFRLKAVQNKKFKSVPKPPPLDGESTSQMTSKKGSDDEDEKEEESGNESGGEDHAGANDGDGEVRPQRGNPSDENIGFYIQLIKLDWWSFENISMPPSKYILSDS